MHVKISHSAIKTQYENHLFYIVKKKKLPVDRLHNQFVLVPRPAKKAGNSIVFVCKTHFINYILEELGFDSVKSYQLIRIALFPRRKFFKISFEYFQYPQQPYQFELIYQYHL